MILAVKVIFFFFYYIEQVALEIKMYEEFLRMLGSQKGGMCGIILFSHSYTHTHTGGNPIRILVHPKSRICHE